MESTPTLRRSSPVDEAAAEAAVRLHAAGEVAEHLAHVGTIAADERAELRDQAPALTRQAVALLTDDHRRALRLVS